MHVFHFQGAGFETEKVGSEDDMCRRHLRAFA